MSGQVLENIVDPVWIRPILRHWTEVINLLAGPVKDFVLAVLQANIERA